MSHKVSEHMSNSPAVMSGTAITSLIDILDKHNISGTAVIDSSNNIIGFVSEQDCLQHIIVSAYHCEPSISVDEVMHKEVLTVSGDDNIIDVAQMMTNNKPKIYPVVTGGRYQGLIQRRQILTALKTGIETCGCG